MWIDTWNVNPQPFTWAKTSDEILNSLAGYLTKAGTDNQETEESNSQNFWHITLVLCLC